MPKCVKTRDVCPSKRYLPSQTREIFTGFDRARQLCSKVRDYIVNDAHIVRIFVCVYVVFGKVTMKGYQVMPRPRISFERKPSHSMALDMRGKSVLALATATN